MSGKDPNHRIVTRDVDITVVKQKAIRQFRQFRQRLGVVCDNRFVGVVTRGHDEGGELRVACCVLRVCFWPTE